MERERPGRGVSVVKPIPFHPDRGNCDLKCIAYEKQPLTVQVVFGQFMDSIHAVIGVVVSEQTFREITPNLC
ncbi:hypothetical protein Bca4012_075843 [Brassica carinata]|uniref:Uncharacterized protein n=1 Tax=Brassica cretica TaxID=69181 RepID=A0ABQ7EG52_BRACR|nr:hypothetical protein DY000_02020927 [Brassica cretica]